MHIRSHTYAKYTSTYMWPCADSACFYSKVVFVRSCNLSKSWTKKTHRALVASARHTSLCLNESLSKIHRSRVIASSMTRCFFIYLFGHVTFIFPGSFVVQPISPWPGYHTCGHATITGPTGSAYEDPSYLCLGRHFSSEKRKKNYPSIHKFMIECVGFLTLMLVKNMTKWSQWSPIFIARCILKAATSCTLMYKKTISTEKKCQKQTGTGKSFQTDSFSPIPWTSQCEVFIFPCMSRTGTLIRATWML